MKYGGEVGSWLLAVVASWGRGGVVAALSWTVLLGAALTVGIYWDDVAIGLGGGDVG